VKLLLDTHALLWWFLGDPLLTRTARDAIQSEASEVWVSAVSAIEITTKFRVGKLSKAATLASTFDDMVGSEDVSLLPITLRHAQVAGLLPIPHKHPFDRLLIAQSQTEGLTLVSNEAIFDTFGVIRLW
jgi:PIN domain nuclease of toxin-antitoxin system